MKFSDLWKVLKDRKRNLLSKIGVLTRYLRLCLGGSNDLMGDVMGVPKKVREAWAEQGQGGIPWLNMLEDPDAMTDGLKTPAMNPVIAFHEALRCGDHKACKCAETNPWKGKRVEVEEAALFEAHFSPRGKMLKDLKTAEGVRGHGKWPAAYLIKHVHDAGEYLAEVERGIAEHDALPAKAKRSREAAALRYKLAKKLSEDGFLDGGDWMTSNMGIGPNLTYDPNQYTEFAPTYGGPFFKQLYLFDYLKQHAYAFEAWNHNPIAKRLVQLIGQYALGRRFTMTFKDAKQQQVWEEHDQKHRITEKASEFWVNEAGIYGELFVDTDLWQSVDPSTIWDIVTDPDNCDDPYYYYQSYATAFQQFTGIHVPGVSDSANQPAQKYVVRQIPWFKILHMKLHCVSNEKRGRSMLFPVLGWLKRVKDLYNAQVIRQWLLSCFIWDVTIDGNQSDVDAYMNAYSQIPNPGSIHAHNKTVERKPMPAMEQGGGRSGGGSEIAESLLAFIATAIGVPKEFLNIISTGGGSRAQALTSAEPFTKVVEDYQAKWESFLTQMISAVFTSYGLPFKPEDVEITFPSVTKDTTTETIANLQQAESMGWLSKRRCAAMAAKELNVTNYEFEKEQATIKEDDAAGLNAMGSTPIPTAGRFSGAAGAGADDPALGESPIHGQGKVDLADQLTTQ